jgi:8-oxo-dGTP diphosphatase
MEFIGAKAALVCGDCVLAYLRDDKPGLQWAGMWDLPGGGREGDETPEQCFLRELDEEFGLRLAVDRLIWRKVWPSLIDETRASVFFAGRLTQAEVAAIRFGDEGQRWEMMYVGTFLAHPFGIPAMQHRTGVAVAAISQSDWSI